MGADAPGIKQKRVADLISLRDEIAVRSCCMPVQKALVNRVVDDFNVIERDLKKLFNLISREIRNLRITYVKCIYVLHKIVDKYFSEIIRRII